LGFRRLFPLRDPELKLQLQEERVFLLDPELHLLEEEEGVRFLDPELDRAPFLAFVTSVSLAAVDPIREDFSVDVDCVLLRVLRDLLRCCGGRDEGEETAELSEVMG
jgi:hypothetical protein